MGTIEILGRVPLQGNVVIQGSKNAALPILAATILTEDTSYIKNCPRIADVCGMIRLLEEIGCRVRRRSDGIETDSSGVGKKVIRLDSEAVTGMRSSLCLLGALIGKCREVVMEYPGGCVIGARPIDMHIRALEQMGVSFVLENGCLRAGTDDLHGAQISLPKVSVGATENVILAAVAAEGETLIRGAAREPEVVALCRFLSACGARIGGIGTDCLTVCGGKKLYGREYTIPADRIVAGTYLFACIGTGGTVFLEKAPCREMEAVIETAVYMGGKIWTSESGMYVQGPVRPFSVPLIRTAPYPGFPTDLQSAALAAETLGDGETVIEETIFENRFRIVGELQKMGACIVQESDRCVRVTGVPYLMGCPVTAAELRGGAALVTAGLMARGKTKVSGCSYIERGYENICRDFRDLGARVVSE